MIRSRPGSDTSIAADDGQLLTRVGAAADILLWLRQVLADLEAAGVTTLGARPENLTAALVSEYLAIKARRLL